MSDIGRVRHTYEVLALHPGTYPGRPARATVPEPPPEPLPQPEPVPQPEPLPEPEPPQPPSESAC